MEAVNPLMLIVTITFMTLLPFFIIACSSFIKISAVLYIVRNAIGIQQVPSNIVVNVIALFVSIYIMAPLINDIYEQVQMTSGRKGSDASDVISAVSPYINGFLNNNTSDKFIKVFHDMSYDLWPKQWHTNDPRSSLLIVMPSFITQEITEAFRIGFLLYMPFIIVDVLVSNILLSLGMMMMSPLTISLPVKLLLFISIDGWTRLLEGLAMTYV